MDKLRIDADTQDRLVNLMREGRSRIESTDWFRVALGLVYLAGLMKNAPIDFKQLDRAYNRSIYHVLGRGHTITSILQFMSGQKVMPTVQSTRFYEALTRHCPEVPLATVPFLLELNLGVARNLSGLEPGGALAEWIAQQKQNQAKEAAQTDAAASDERI